MNREFRIQAYLSGLLLLLWIATCLWPASRRQIAHDMQAYVSTSPRTYDDSPSYKQLAMRYPDDLVAQKVAASPQEFVALCRQHPHDATLVAWCFRRWFLWDDRRQGPLSNPAWPSPAPLVTGVWTPPPPAPRADWEQFLELAQQGQTLEPDNVFFDVMALNALFALRRDAEAENLLHRAAQKTRYDAHYSEQIETYLEAISLGRGVSPRDLRPGEKLSQCYYFTFGDFNKVYAATKWAKENAIVAQAQGQHARAIGLMSDILRMGKAIRKSSWFVLNARLGGNVERQASWIYLNRPTAAGAKQGRSETLPRATTVAGWRADTRSLSAYTRAHGRRDVALEAEREWAAIDAWTKAVKPYYASDLVFPVVLPDRVVTLASVLEEPRHFILMSLGPVLLLFAGTAWIFWRTKSCISRPQSALKLIGLGFILSMVLFVGLNFADAFLAQLSSLSQNMAEVPTLWEWTNWWQGTVWSQSIRDRFPALLWCLPALFLTWYGTRCAFPAVTRPTCAKPTFWLLHRDAWPRYEDKLARFDPSPIINALLHDVKVVVKWLFAHVVLWGGLLVLLYWAGVWPWAIMPSLLCLVMVRGVIWYRSGGRTIQWQQTAAPTSALALGVLWSGTLLWLVLWRVEAPYRAQFDQRWEQVMAQGEYQVVRQKMGL